MMGQIQYKLYSAAIAKRSWINNIGSRQSKGNDKIKSLGSVSRRVSAAASCLVTIVHKILNYGSNIQYTATTKNLDLLQMQSRLEKNQRCYVILCNE